jgi:hypothetical protein
LLSTFNPPIEVGTRDRRIGLRSYRSRRRTVVVRSPAFSPACAVRCSCGSGTCSTDHASSLQGGRPCRIRSTASASRSTSSRGIDLLRPTGRNRPRRLLRWRGGPVALSGVIDEAAATHRRLSADEAAAARRRHLVDPLEAQPLECGSLRAHHRDEHSESDPLEPCDRQLPGTAATPPQAQPPS